MNKYIAIPASVIEEQQERREFDYLNSLTRQHRGSQIRARQNEAAANRAYYERNQKLAAIAFGFLFGSLALIVLAHTGAVAGWLVHLLTVGGGVGVGYQFGRSKQA